jgi:hypothetical protein
VHALDDLVSFVLSFRAWATGEAVSLCDVVGFLASGLVVAAFCMKDIIPLRLMALASNVAFLVYGIGLGLAPIWLLHAILLPVNCWRLWQQLSQYGEAAPERCSWWAWNHLSMECAKLRPRRKRLPQ